jgi:hypothetical protein
LDGYGFRERSVGSLARMLPSPNQPETPVVLARRAEPGPPEAPTRDVARSAAPVETEALFVQRAEEASPAPAAAAAAAPSAAAGESPAALDELAGRLYDRIRARLRDELLIDRERAGMLTDVR